MKTNIKNLENNKLDFCLSRCRIYDVFIEKNSIEFYVGQIKYTGDNEYWKINFSITNIDRNLINSQFDLKNDDSGFFSTVHTSEDEYSIQICNEKKILDYFVGSISVRLEKSYNFN